MGLNTPQIARSKPANFNREDPFLLADQLTEEERMIVTPQEHIAKIS